jgi:AraC-like DNA-binding protein
MDAEESAAAMAAMSGVALACLGRFARERRDDAADPAEAADEALVAAARAFIAAHGDSPHLTAALVAAAIGCSRTRLFGVFQARGLSVADAIRTARLGHARALLRDGALDIGEVALRCGYSDGSAFGKAFRRAFGLSPRDWRMSIT